MAPKVSAICDFVLSERLSLMAVTETWLKGDSRDDSAIAVINSCLPDYQIVHRPRSGRGGGVAVIYHSGFKTKQNTLRHFSSFEYLDLQLTSSATSVRLINIYRPPSKGTNNTQMFLNELSSFIEELLIFPGHFVITGDFNFHVDVQENRDALQFLDLLNCFDLQLHVNFPTHNRGHTLDLVITRTTDLLISGVNCTFSLPSDHAAITFFYGIPRPPPTRTKVNYRKLKNIDLNAFSADILHLPIISSNSSDADDLVNQFNLQLTSLLDSHAPARTRIITVRPHAPWFNNTLRDEKKKKRACERKWRSTGLEIHKQIFLNYCSRYQDLLKNTKEHYYSSRIRECDDSKLFSEINKIIKPSTKAFFPSFEDASQMAESFATHFNNKTNNLLLTLGSSTTAFNSIEPTTSHHLMHFLPTSPQSVHETIVKCKTKSCSLDPIPSCLLKGCSTALERPISTIINASLATGCVPSSLKVAKVTPCLKKPSLEKNDLNNYRPISNLPYLSKALERVVGCQLQQHLSTNLLLSSFQSAYRRNFSTETALLRVQNDILVSLDRGDEVLLVLLDYSAAFDTIDHSTLLWRLENRFGVKGTALNWFISYLNGRQQFVSINGSSSSSMALKHGVPQGSVLGPLLFTLYISPIEDLILSNGIDCMFYADDSQLYLTLNKASLPSSKIATLEKCLHDIKGWTVENKLFLNNSKTDVIHLHSKFGKNPSVISKLSVSNSEIEPTGKVRNLGVIFDQHMTMKDHVSNISKSASYALHNISKIRIYLDSSTTERLVHAFISSRLDSCNSLLFGLPGSELDRLQLIQNSAARLVLKSKKSNHVTPLLYDLHWLPVKFRIVYKMCLIMYKISRDMAPAYLCELVKQYKPTRCLRSSSKSLYTVPSARVKAFGDRAFAIAGPKTWNSLPEDLKLAENIDIFKTKLKTHLFKLAYQ